MRTNTPIYSSPVSSTHKSPSSLTTYTLSPSGAVNGPIKVKPSANDMKDTSTVRIANPNFRKLNVEATDDFVAPVAKLSQWLASDPTKPKKEFLTVRKGNNIIAKSNTFEKQTIAFGTKKQMLQEVAEKKVVTDNRKQFEEGVGKESFKKTAVEAEKVIMEAKVVVATEASTEPEVDAVTEAVAAISVAVVDKEVVSADAQLEAMEELAEVKVAEASIVDTAEKMAETESQEVAVVEEKATEKKEETAVTKFAVAEKVAAVEKKVASPAFVVKKKATPPVVADEKTFEQAKAEFDSGKPSSVQLRKQKIEEMEREARRRANNPYGLMKSSWKRPHPSRGLPSDAWKRTFQGNLPPKKTFAELP